MEFTTCSEGWRANPYDLGVIFFVLFISSASIALVCFFELLWVSVGFLIFLCFPLQLWYWNKNVFLGFYIMDVRTLLHWMDLPVLGFAWQKEFVCLLSNKRLICAWALEHQLDLVSSNLEQSKLFYKEQGDIKDNIFARTWMEVLVFGDTYLSSRSQVITSVIVRIESSTAFTDTMTMIRHGNPFIIQNLKGNRMDRRGVDQHSVKSLSMCLNMVLRICYHEKVQSLELVIVTSLWVRDLRVWEIRSSSPHTLLAPWSSS